MPYARSRSLPCSTRWSVLFVNVLKTSWLATPSMSRAADRSSAMNDPVASKFLRSQIRSASWRRNSGSSCWRRKCSTISFSSAPSSPIRKPTTSSAMRSRTSGSAYSVKRSGGSIRCASASWITRSGMGPLFPPCGTVLAEPGLQRAQLVPQRGRELVTQRLEVLADERHLGPPFVGIDADRRLDRLGGDVEPLDVEVVGAGDEADGGLLRAGGALAPPEHPLEHARVLTEAGPHELAVGVLAEPVHAVDPWQLRFVGASRHAQPVGEVVGHVVAAERQHREGVASQLAKATDGGGGLLGAHRGAHEHAVLPVARLEHQRHGRGAAPAEQERGDGHTLRVLPLGRDNRALRRRHAEPCRW